MNKMKANIIALIVICFIVLYISLKDDFNEVVKQIYSVNIGWFVFACFLMFMFFIFRALELHDLVKSVDSKYSFKKALGIVVIGQFFASVTPSSFGAQPAQIFFLNKERIRASHATRIIMQYSATYQIALLIISFITILLAYQFNIFSNMAAGFSFKELVVVSFLIHFVVLMFLLGVNFSKKTNTAVIDRIIRVLSFLKIVRNKEATLVKWNNYLHDFHDGSGTLFKDKRILIKGILCNILAVLCMYSIPLVIMYSLKDYGALDFMTTTVASSYTNIISSFMPSPGGTGGFEYFFTQFFGVFITGVALTTVMLIWRFVTYYFVLFVGSIMLLMYKEGAVKE